MYGKGRAWLELDLNHLNHNVAQFQAILPPGCELMPAVKADAYGHGAGPVCRALQKTGVHNFCVASVEEGIKLRKEGIRGQILILGYTHPALFAAVQEYDLTQTVVDLEYAEVLNDFGGRRRCRMKAHVGVDTGMHRLGERSTDVEKILEMWSLSSLDIRGVFSHLCVSDGTTEEETAFTKEQIRKYDTLIRALHLAGISGFKTHLQGSYGILNYPELHYDYARPGIALYGVLSSSGDSVRCAADLKPVLSLKTRIECVHGLHTGEALGYGLTFTAKREMKTAVISVGYADGIPRCLSNRGYALVRGKKAPIIGRICMDQMFLDVTEIPEAVPGDEVVLIGSSGAEKLSAARVAAWSDTITNELLSRLGARLQRLPVEAADPEEMVHDMTR